MDLSFLDKSSGVMPLLVSLYDSHKLYSLTKDKPEVRTQLTTAIGQLMGMKLSARETELVADVLIALMRQAEIDLRQAVSERLSVIENVPLRVVLQIANDKIEVAAPMLRNSLVLSDVDLLYIVKSKSPEYWQAIAARQDLSDHVVNVLADTRDFDTAVTLAENLSITLTEHALSVLSDLAQGNDVLGAPLLRRDEISNDIAARLYAAAGKELKQYILDTFEIETDVLIQTVDDVVLEFVESTQQNEFMPTPAMINTSDEFYKRGILNINLMLETLKRGQIQMFVAQLSSYTRLSPQVVTEILAQPSGQGLAVACKAFDIIKPDFTSIYLLTNRVRNQGRMIDMKDMTRALHYFENVKRDVALEIIKNTTSAPHIV